jgi:hypothetical protein
MFETGVASCYCVPYMHLREFYGRAGFVPITCESAPAFLRERVASYRARGLDVLVMHRRGHSTPTEGLNRRCSEPPLRIQESH